MHNTNFSPLLGPSPILLFHPVCNGIFHTYFRFVIHIQITHPLSFEKNNILHSSVYASGTFLPGNVRLERNNNILIMPTPSSYLNHPMINSGKVLPIDRQLMARRNWFVSIRRDTTLIMDREQMERRNRVESSREAIVDRTTPLIDELDVPISLNADELVKIDEEQTNLYLKLRL
ncbi:hypothetical protein EJD97_018422 [Solanum chilense]|uniref:Uncharacterized protein n=1 Tax=Solanum chilense TaxID=4083 RepID=A0A6N2B0Z4_SOLCI|nr:hypothetical protein EJD97_018422 [Solanum chilense]